MREEATPDPVARVWHLVTAAAATVGLVWQLSLTIRGVIVPLDGNGLHPTVATRLVRFFSYFTIESNLLVAATAATLALRPDRDGPVWRVLRLMTLFGITVTGAVYTTLLRGVVELHGAAAVTNALLHYVSPLMAVIGWLVFGPRPRITPRVLLTSMVWPALYVTWVVVLGAATGWYPYPFTDVGLHGYPAVIRNGIGLLVLMVAVGAVFLVLDRRLPRRPRQLTEPVPTDRP